MTGFAGGGGELPFFNDAGLPYSGAITSLGLAEPRLCRPHLGQCRAAGRSVAARRCIRPASPAGDATRPNFIYNQLIDSVAAFRAQPGIGAVDAPFSGTLGSFMRQVISQQGEAAENADEPCRTARRSWSTRCKQRFSDGAAVNIDVEMANLLTLQNAYGANARVMSTVKEMFDLLMQI